MEHYEANQTPVFIEDLRGRNQREPLQAIFAFAGRTVADARRVVQELNLEANPADGNLSNVICSAADGSLLVTDLWLSVGAALYFYEQRLLPALAKLGFSDQPQITLATPATYDLVGEKHYQVGNDPYRRSDRPGYIQGIEGEGRRRSIEG